MAVLCLWNLATQPPAVNPDGGFPAAAEAGARIVASTGDEEVRMESLPDFKSVEAYAYPVVRDGHVISSDLMPGNLVVICDARFEAAIGAACDGPAEDAFVALVRPARICSSPTGSRRPWPDHLGLPGRSLSADRRESRTPAPQTLAFAAPETRMLEGAPGRAPRVASSGRAPGRWPG